MRKWLLLGVLLLAAPVAAQNEINWSAYPSATSYLATELNALADAGKVLGAAIDNTTASDMYVDVEIFVNTQGSARSAGAYIAIYFLPSVDGTNYTYGDASTVPPANTLVCTMPLDAAVTARYQSCRGLLQPASKWKLLVTNATGQAFAATGTTVKYSTYSAEVN
ncbi:hypothetical protein [Microbacterium sp.]|uniref:hypothetical protein n=1 Tax=Microbacterium sp. TaxID=51671 RepID=UPI0027377235|nr:hypothetical protein [Microbacterium sp.]MDP3950217.1 hypothetical protein [Microbacterium sp.]